MTPAAVPTVPFFDYRKLFTQEEAELVAIFRDVGRRGAFILQNDLARFEANLGHFLGADRVLGVANGTDGLLIALRAAGIGAGDEVIFSSHTMVATAAAIHFAGAAPVAVDCGPDHLIDPEAVTAAITPRTRAILPTQLNGRVADMDALARIAQRRGLTIVEDAAQALGASFKGRKAGTFGIGGGHQFLSGQSAGLPGRRRRGGGAITMSCSSASCQLRDHGKSADGEIVSWGLNSRLDNLQAAILDYRLGSLERSIDRRRAIARRYRSALGEVGEIVLPPGPDQDPDHFDVYQNYEIEAERRDDLREFLRARGVGTLVAWGGKAVHQWERLGLTASLPATERLMARSLMLPMNPGLSDGDVDYVAAGVRGFYR